MTEPEKRLRIYITPHAADRARARFRGWRETHPELISAMVYEVAAALRDGRRAKRLPRWASYGSRKHRAGGKGGPTCWWVWNEEETHAYLVTRDRYRDADYIVATVLGRAHA